MKRRGKDGMLQTDFEPTNTLTYAIPRVPLLTLGAHAQRGYIQ